MGLIDITTESGTISVNPNNCNLSKYTDAAGTNTYAVFLDGIGNVSISESDYNRIKNNTSNTDAE